MNRIEGNANARPHGIYLWTETDGIVTLRWYATQKEAEKAFKPTDSIRIEDAA